MNIELESMAIEMPPVEGHPNREPFRGVLTLVDVPSGKADCGNSSGGYGRRSIWCRVVLKAGVTAQSWPGRAGERSRCDQSWSDCGCRDDRGCGSVETTGGSVRAKSYVFRSGHQN